MVISLIFSLKRHRYDIMKTKTSMHEVDITVYHFDLIVCLDSLSKDKTYSKTVLQLSTRVDFFRLIIFESLRPS